MKPRGEYSRAATPEQQEQLEFIAGILHAQKQAAEVFNRVKPKLAVYAHAAMSAGLIARTRNTYSDRLEGGRRYDDNRGRLDDKSRRLVR